MLRGILGASFLSLAIALTPSVAEARRVVFINTDPVTLVDTGQDPTTNAFSSTGFTAGPISGWVGATDEQKKELLYLMKEGALPFDMELVLERPASGTYDMLVMGTQADEAALFAAAGCSTATGLADCDDAQAENIAFLFYGCLNATQQEQIHRLAFLGLYALGFGWGLENLSVSGQIMGNYSASALQFGDTCVDISGASQCTHVGCAAGSQNSTADLNQAIGARVDDGPPEVTITAPADGELVATDFTVTADVTDMFGGLTVELEIVEAGQTDPDEGPTYEWPLSAPDGAWTLRVNVTDADGGTASDEIVVCVNEPDCHGETGTTDSGTTTGGGDTTDGGTTTDGDSDDGGTSTHTGSATGTLTTSEPEAPPPGTSGGPGVGFGDDAGAGCGCSTDRELPWAAGLPVWLVVVGRRRRLTRSG